MAESSAQLSNYRQSPRKVGLVVGAIRGKRVVGALQVLEAMPKRAAGPIAKLLQSAVANASVKGFHADELVISKATVDKGMVIKRFTPRARGSSSPIHKRCSHVKLELSQIAPVVAKAPKATKPAAKAKKTK